MNWYLQCVAFLPNALWFTGTVIAGRKNRWGWAFLGVSELAWIWMAVATRLWSILPWAVLGTGLYWYNYRRWVRDELTTTTQER